MKLSPYYSTSHYIVGRITSSEGKVVLEFCGVKRIFFFFVSCHILSTLAYVISKSIFAN